MNTVLNDETKIFVVNALKAAIDDIDKTRIPGADRLSEAKDQTEQCREYFGRHAENLKNSVAEIRALIKEVMSS